MLERRLSSMGCLTAFVAAWTFCIADGAAVLGVLALGACGAAWVLGGDGGRPLLPRFVVNLLVLAAILRAVFAVAEQGNPLVSDLAAFLVHVLLIKLYDRRAPRDEAQLLGLSVFVVIGSLLTSNTLAIGAAVLVFTPLLIYTAMLQQVHEGWWRRRRQRERASLPVGELGEFEAGRLLRSLRRVTVGAVSVSVLLAVAVFVLTPRGLGAGVLGRAGVVDTTPVVGFTDIVRLGQAGLLSESQTPVLDVKVRDDEGRNIGDSLGALYLRGFASSVYDPMTGGWVRPGDAGMPDGRVVQAPVSRDGTVSFGSLGDARLHYEYEFTTRAAFESDQQYLFLPWRPIELRYTASDRVDVVPSLLTVRTPRGGRQGYTVIASPEYESRRDGAREILDPGLERVRRYTVDVLRGDAGAPDPERMGPADTRRAALVIQDHLRREFSYTLEMVAPEPGEDPIEMFLFRTQRGHCEYFASAMAVMCQSIGVPARLVTGYMATEYNGISRQYVVRQSHAHAWVEVEVGPGRWVTFDPSPPEELERIQEARRGVFSRLRQMYEAIEFRWIDTVVAFDDSTRSSLLRVSPGEMGFFEDIGGALRSVAARLAELAGSGPAGVAAAVVIVGAFGFVVFLIGSALWRRLRGVLGGGKGGGEAGFAPDPELARLLEEAEFYARFGRLLESAGLSRPRALPGLEHAYRLGAVDPELGGAAVRLTRLYYRVRFGRRSLTEGEREEAARALSVAAERLNGRANGVAGRAGAAVR